LNIAKYQDQHPRGFQFKANGDDIKPFYELKKKKYEKISLTSSSLFWLIIHRSFSIGSHLAQEPVTLKINQKVISSSAHTESSFSKSKPQPQPLIRQYITQFK